MNKLIRFDIDEGVELETVSRYFSASIQTNLIFYFHRQLTGGLAPSPYTSTPLFLAK